MSYINNMNPRRMIWFNQNAPKNKTDLWLSYNRHYEDTSDDETTDAQQTTDNPSQRNCDLILKAWDCGRWIPIVGFNTTAANKIDIVEGNTLYHPAIFTGENPNDLYDAGTLGSLLSNPNFVTEQEWHDVFNSSNYDWGDIFGDTNWFGDLTWSIIQGGSSSYHLPWATTTQCGGILSDIHPNIESQREAGVQVRFAPQNTNLYDVAYNGLRIPQHHLAITGKQLIYAINEEFSNHPETPGITINIQELVEALEGVFKNSSSIGFNATFGQATDPNVYTHIWGVGSSNAGRFLRIKNPYPSEGTGWAQNNHAMEWVDIQEGDGIDINTSNSIMTIGINTDGAQTNQVLTKTSNGVSWEDPQSTEYGYDNLIDITNNTVSISMNGAEAGDVIICDGSNNNYFAKWGAVPNPDLATVQISCGNGALTINGNQLTSDGTITVNGSEISSSTYTMNSWTFYNIQAFKEIHITSIQQSANPYYIRLNNCPPSANVSCIGDVIDPQDLLVDMHEKDVFVTLQFGIAKFEEIASIGNI